MKRPTKHIDPCTDFICGMCAYCIDPELEGVVACVECQYNDGSCRHCMRHIPHRVACEKGRRQEVTK